jgi:hypothetical protein
MMTAIPTERAFQSMVCLNQLKDCFVTCNDIKVAHAIFGPDLANIRGGTVQRNPECVDTNYVEIPWELLFFDQHVTLFVDLVPFLVLV